MKNFLDFIVYLQVFPSRCCHLGKLALLTVIRVEFSRYVLITWHATILGSVYDLCNKFTPDDRWSSTSILKCSQTLVQHFLEKYYYFIKYRLSFVTFFPLLHHKCHAVRNSEMDCSTICVHKRILDASDHFYLQLGRQIILDDKKKVVGTRFRPLLCISLSSSSKRSCVSLR